MDQQKQVMTVNRASEPPDGGYGWVVLVSCALCMCTSIGMQRILGLVFVEVIDIYDVNRTQTFLIVVMIRVFGFAFAPLVGKLLTKFDYCVILCSGCLFLSFSLILTSCATAYWQVVITFGCLQGIGVNCVMSTSTLTVGMYFTKRRSLALGMLYSLGSINGFISPILFNWLMESYHFHGALLIMGGISLNSCAFGMLVRQPTWLKKETTKLLERESKSIQHDENSVPVLQTNVIGNQHAKKLTTIKAKKEETEVLCITLNTEDKSKEKASQLKSLLMEIKQDLRLFKDGLFLLLLISRSLAMITFGYFLSMLPDFVEVEIKPAISKQEVAFVLSMTSVGDIFVRLAIGLVLDKLPWAKKHTLAGVSFSMGLIAILFQFSQTYTHLLVASICFGLCGGIIMVVQHATEMELMGPKRVHMANGLSRFFIGSVNAISGVLIGYMRDRLGSYKMCLTFVGTATILGGLVWLAEPIVTKCCPTETHQEPVNTTQKDDEKC